MKSRARSMFDHAQVYERAARLLNASGASDPAMLLPSMVNAALSLELYCKALHILDRGNEFKVKGRHSHDFAALFENLTEQTKQSLLSQFSTELSVRNNTDIRALEESMNIVVSKDLKTNLSHWASVFVDVRYAFDFIDNYGCNPSSAGQARMGGSVAG